MKVELTEAMKNAIKKDALDAYPKECCGIIFPDIVLPCRNLSDIDNRFMIDPLDYLRASFLGKIKVIYHSHPNGGSFSELDKLCSKEHNIDYVLYNVKEDRFEILESC